MALNPDKTRSLSKAFWPVDNFGEKQINNLPDVNDYNYQVLAETGEMNIFSLLNQMVIEIKEIVS